MDRSFWMILNIGLAVLALLIFFLALRRRRELPLTSNYRTLFTLGVIWLAVGIPTNNPGLYGLGAILLITGLHNRSKWDQERTWSDLSPEQRRIKLILLIGLTALLVLGVLYYIFYR